MSNTSAQKEKLRGRPIEHRLGDVLATLNLFAKKDSLTNIDDLSQLLDMNHGSAADILDTLSNEHTEDLDPLLPLCPKEQKGEYQRIATTNPLSGKPLRLTETQAKACDNAFGLLGIPADDSERARLMAAFYPDGYVAEILDKNGNMLDDEDRWALSSLRVCAQSIAQATRNEGDLPQIIAPVVEFTYRGRNDSELGERTRRVVPCRIRWASSAWVVDAFDLDARAIRTFRAHAMKSTHLASVTSCVPAISAETPEHGIVKLICKKEIVWQVLLWDRAAVVGVDGDNVRVEIPYYRPEWLPRRILSLGTKAAYTNPELQNDPQLRDEVREIAKNLYKRACKLGVIEE